MMYKLLVGQNQWLRVEYLGVEKRQSLYQVVEVHRCPQIKQGDMLREYMGMFVAYSDAEATRPRYRLPSHTTIEYDDEDEEE